MSSIRPLALTRLNASHAQALRTLGASVEGLSVAGLGDDLTVQVRLTPIAAKDLSQVDSAGYQRLAMEWAGGRLMLDVTPDGAAIWARAVLGAEAYATLPYDWMEAALAHAVERVSAALEHSGRGPLELAQISTIASGQSLLSGFHPFWFEVSLGEERLQGLLQLDSMSLLILSSIVPATKSASGPHADSTLPLPMLIGIGHTDLDLDQLRRLKPKGVVMIAQPYGSEPQGLLLRTRPGPGRAWALSAKLDDGQLIILEPAHAMANDQTPVSDGDQEATSLSELPVRLSFDLGERVITLAELQTLDSGSALPLDRPLQDFVTIRANGAVIGEGQLVDMDGRLGVMVSRLSLTDLAR